MRIPIAAAAALLALPAMGVAQEAADTLDLKRIFDARDSVAGRPVVDSLPQLINCPRFDPQQVRGDEMTFSFERRPELERYPQHLQVEVEFVVRQDGKVDRRNLRIIRSTDSRLEQSVEYWIRRCVYRPGMIGEHKIRVRMREKFDLRLNR